MKRGCSMARGWGAHPERDPRAAAPSPPQSLSHRPAYSSPRLSTPHLQARSPAQLLSPLLSQSSLHPHSAPCRYRRHAAVAQAHGGVPNRLCVVVERRVDPFFLWPPAPHSLPASASPPESLARCRQIAQGRCPAPSPPPPTPLAQSSRPPQHRYALMRRARHFDLVLTRAAAACPTTASDGGCCWRSPA